MKSKQILLISLFFIILPLTLAQTLNMNQLSDIPMDQLCEQMQIANMFENSTIYLNETSLMFQELDNKTLDEVLGDIDPSLLPPGFDEIPEEFSNLTIKDLEDLGLIENSGFQGIDMSILEEGSIIFEIAGAINKTTTIDVDYNNTDCIQVTINIENGEPKSLYFGENQGTPLYLKLDLIFLEDIFNIMRENQGATGFSSIMLYMQVGGRVMSALFSGQLLISPIWGVFDLFNALGVLMNS